MQEEPLTELAKHVAAMTQSLEVKIQFIWWQIQTKNKKSLKTVATMLELGNLYVYL